MNDTLEWYTLFIMQECIDYINDRTEDWGADLRWIFHDGSGWMQVDVDSLLKDHFKGIVD